MDSAILEAINYLCDIGAHNIDSDSIIKTLNFIIINNSINKSIPPLLNRSLPATPIVEPNTILHVLSIGNSSMNARLETLEKKLCRKIMEMKSYFMDDLQPLKQEAPVTKKWGYNQDKTAALKK